LAGNDTDQRRNSLAEIGATGICAGYARDSGGELRRRPRRHDLVGSAGDARLPCPSHFWTPGRQNGPPL